MLFTYAVIATSDVIWHQSPICHDQSTLDCHDDCDGSSPGTGTTRDKSLFSPAIRVTLCTNAISSKLAEPSKRGPATVMYSRSRDTMENRLEILWTLHPFNLGSKVHSTMPPLRARSLETFSMIYKSCCCPSACLTLTAALSRPLQRSTVNLITHSFPSLSVRRLYFHISSASPTRRIRTASSCCVAYQQNQPPPTSSSRTNVGHVQECWRVLATTQEDKLSSSYSAIQQTRGKLPAPPGPNCNLEVNVALTP